MGNVVKQCTDDTFFRGGDNKEKLQIKEEVENLMSNGQMINDSCNNCEIVESYDARNNYFYMDQNIIKIQRSYRNYLLAKKDTIVMTESSRGYSTFSTISINNNEGCQESSLKGLFLLKKKNYKHQGFYSKDKRKQGFGIVSWEDGSKLYSNFDSNKANGIAKFIDSSGQIFYGEYTKNRPSGYGVYIEKGEVTYEGIWTNNVLNGLGVEMWKDGTIYKGEFVANKKDGFGIYCWPDGTIYQGEWKNDKMEGNGMLIYSDHRTYEGSIKDGYMNGYGLFTWPDGKKFFGNYCKDIKEGFGIFIWTIYPIQAYIGFWSKGKQNGLGMKISSSHIKYGIWKKGSKEIWLQGSWELRKYCPNDKRHYLPLIENGYNNILSLLNPEMNQIK